MGGFGFKFELTVKKNNEPEFYIQAIKASSDLAFKYAYKCILWLKASTPVLDIVPEYSFKICLIRG